MNVSNEDARRALEEWGLEPVLDADRYEVRDGVAVDLWTGAEYVASIDPETGDAIVVNRFSGAEIDRMKL